LIEVNHSRYTVVLIALISLFAHSSNVQSEWEKIASSAKGKVGAAAVLLETGESIELDSEEHFPMQSVYKFPIGMAVLHEVDDGTLKLDQQVEVRKTDLLPKGFHSPIRDQHPQGNISLSLGDLLRFAVAESDGTASDVLLRIAGGPQRVTAYLRSLGVTKMEIATTEQEMSRSDDVQYRNWATPRSAVDLLRRFYSGQGLSSAGRALVLKWMTETDTGPNRIKGLLPPGTIVAHKTGTSRTKDGFTAATNDIGIITLPGGRHIAIAVFVSDSKADEHTRESIIAQIAKSAYDHWTD
jgi:beta-lactamase class A